MLAEFFSSLNGLIDIFCGWVGGGVKNWDLFFGGLNYLFAEK